MSTIVIPARKGSKRIPNKNFRDFCGKPMVSRAYDLANTIGMPLISTDATRNFVFQTCLHKRTEHADDNAGLLEVMQDVIMWDMESKGYTVPNSDIYVCLLPCTPLLRPESLQAAIEAHKSTPDVMMASVVEYAHPIDRALSVCQGRLEAECERMLSARTQDCHTTYHDAGAFYVASAKRWMSGEPILEGARPWLLPRNEAIDIDTEEDWQVAEQMYRGQA